MGIALSGNDIRVALDATGRPWTLGVDGVYHVDMVNGLILDLTLIRLQGHWHVAFGSDRNGFATYYGLECIDRMDADRLRSFIQSLCLVG